MFPNLETKQIFLKVKKKDDAEKIKNFVAKLPFTLITFHCVHLCLVISNMVPPHGVVSEREGC